MTTDTIISHAHWTRYLLDHGIPRGWIPEAPDAPQTVTQACAATLQYMLRVHVHTTEAIDRVLKAAGALVQTPQAGRHTEGVEAD